jgi:hypothetical protein
VPDESFEAFWAAPGGAALVAMHRLFAGATLPAHEVRAVLGVSPDQFRALREAAESMGFVVGDEERVTFAVLDPQSAQRVRLDWCLEPHAEELEAVVRRLRSALLVRYLGAPPGQLG